MKIIFFKPLVSDIKAMQSLVVPEVENGNILARDEGEMATTIRSYTCVKISDENGSNEHLIGFIALHIHTPLLAEIRSLIISNNFRRQGLAKQLIEKTMEEAKNLNLKELLVLTYQEKLFKDFKFNVIDKESIPNPKIWIDCIKCKHFPRCDEIALVKTLQ